MLNLLCPVITVLFILAALALLRAENTPRGGADNSDGGS